MITCPKCGVEIAEPSLWVINSQEYCSENCARTSQGLPAKLIGPQMLLPAVELKPFKEI